MVKTKTFWASMTAILGAIGGFFTGDLALAEMLQLIVTSALALFVRHGVQKAEVAAEKKPAGNYASGSGSYNYGQQ